MRVPDGTEEDVMTIETLATFALTLGLPVWLLAEELMRRLDGRSDAQRAVTTRTPQRAPVRAARRAA
jgi:hypothetical protein